MSLFLWLEWGEVIGPGVESKAVVSADVSMTWRCLQTDRLMSQQHFWIPDPPRVPEPALPLMPEPSLPLMPYPAAAPNARWLPSQPALSYQDFLAW